VPEIVDPSQGLHSNRTLSRLSVAVAEVVQVEVIRKKALQKPCKREPLFQAI